MLQAHPFAGIEPPCIEWCWYGACLHVVLLAVSGSGLRVQGSGFRVQGSGFRVQGSGFRIHVSKYVQG